ncbi:MAG: hypothetical protein H6Q64_757, partial [Firmicutes bacterium]|nr:hypothetical protein [Bacillota bacterium]
KVKSIGEEMINSFKRMWLLQKNDWEWENEYLFKQAMVTSN